MEIYLVIAYIIFSCVILAGLPPFVQWRAFQENIDVKYFKNFHFYIKNAFICQFKRAALFICDSCKARRSVNKSYHYLFTINQLTVGGNSCRNKTVSFIKF